LGRRICAGKRSSGSDISTSDPFRSTSHRAEACAKGARPSGF
jgi:hypothetical protein